MVLGWLVGLRGAPFAAGRGLQGAFAGTAGAAEKQRPCLAGKMWAGGPGGDSVGKEELHP